MQDGISRWRPAPVQLLAGDFNAEPEEKAMKFLLDAENFDQCSGGTNAFVDAWEAVQPGLSEAQRTAQDSISRDGLTFPSCNPIKRIDFIMVRNHTFCNAGGSSTSGTADDKEENSQDKDPWYTAATVVVRRTEVVGKQPSADTLHLASGREGLGMLDLDSPNWASDHFAVVSDLEIVAIH